MEVLGFSEVPEAGDKLIVVEEEKKARELAERRKELQKKWNLNESKSFTRGLI